MTLEYEEVVEDLEKQERNKNMAKEKMSEGALERLCEEKKQLAEKLTRLHAFICSKAFKALDDENCVLLQIQESAMSTYLKALERRWELNS